jgi:hypothetical protein
MAYTVSERRHMTYTESERRHMTYTVSVWRKAHSNKQTIPALVCPFWGIFFLPIKVERCHMTKEPTKQMWFVDKWDWNVVLLTPVNFQLILRPRRQICKNGMKHGDDGWTCGSLKPNSDRVLEYLTCIVKVDRDYQFFESPSAYILARRIWYGIQLGTHLCW